LARTRRSKPMFTRFSHPLYIALAMTTWDMIIVSQMDHMITEGPAKLRVLRQNPSVRSAPTKANRARGKATQMVASSWHFLEPHRGDPTSSSFISEFRSGGFLHAPPCGMASSPPGFPDIDYEGKSLETTCPGFAWGGISPCLVLWRGTCPCWLSPANGDLGSTQILTWHYAASLSPLVSSRTRGPHPARKVPVVQPLQVIETPTDGSMGTPHHLLTTQTKLWGFIKPSARNKVVHIELNLRLSFSSTAASGATRWVPPRYSESQPWRV
jgi:hypothetical protein